MTEAHHRRALAFKEGMNRYKSLLLRVAKVQPFDVLVSSEGTQQGDLNINVVDLDVLERAHLLKGKTKETGRNVYREYELTKEEPELVKKLSKET